MLLMWGCVRPVCCVGRVAGRCCGTGAGISAVFSVGGSLSRRGRRSGASCGAVVVILVGARVTPT